MTILDLEGFYQELIGRSSNIFNISRSSLPPNIYKRTLIDKFPIKRFYLLHSFMWHSSLIEGLYKKHSEKEIQEGIIISFETDMKKRSFRLFENYITLMDFIDETPIQLRRFHEVTRENANQKPRFDIDIDHNNLPHGKDLSAFGNEVLSECIKSSIKVLANEGIILSPKKVYVFSSCDSKKISYHVIINGYHHSSCNEAKAFYQKVMEASSIENMSRYVDRGIYSKNHALRTLFSTKLGSERVKVFQQKYFLDGRQIISSVEKCNSKKHLDLTLLSYSLITFVKSSILLPSWYVPEEKIIYHQRNIDNDMLGNSIKEFIEGVFTVNTSEGGFITLTRISPSYCEVCERVHERVGGCIFVSRGKVYYNCGRSGKGVENSTYICECKSGGDILSNMECYNRLKERADRLLKLNPEMIHNSYNLTESMIKKLEVKKDKKDKDEKVEKEAPKKHFKISTLGEESSSEDEKDSYKLESPMEIFTNRYNSIAKRESDKDTKKDDKSDKGLCYKSSSQIKALKDVRKISTNPIRKSEKSQKGSSSVSKRVFYFLNTEYREIGKDNYHF